LGRIIRLVLSIAIAFGFCGFVSHRLNNEIDRVSGVLASTIPHGGHHLFGLIVGGAIAACAIAFVRLLLGARHHRLAISTRLWQADAAIS
jgi:hypothetical protein